LDANSEEPLTSAKRLCLQGANIAPVELKEVPMLGMLALVAMTMGGADDATCTRLVDESALESIVAAAEADLFAAEAALIEAEIYADAEMDFADRLHEAGLAGSTLGRDEARIAADARRDGMPVARNR
jgi:hypothetical protein